MVRQGHHGLEEDLDCVHFAFRHAWTFARFSVQMVQ